METPSYLTQSSFDESGLIISSPSNDDNDDTIFTPQSTPPASPFHAATATVDNLVPSQIIGHISSPLVEISSPDIVPVRKARGSDSRDFSDRNRSDAEAGCNVSGTATTVHQYGHLVPRYSAEGSGILHLAALTTYPIKLAVSGLKPSMTTQFSTSNEDDPFLIRPLDKAPFLDSHRNPLAEKEQTSGVTKASRAPLAKLESPKPNLDAFNSHDTLVQIPNGSKIEKKVRLDDIRRSFKTCAPHATSKSTSPKSERGLLGKANQMGDNGTTGYSLVNCGASTKITAIEDELSNLLVEVQQEIKKIRRLCLTRPDLNVSQLHNDLRTVEADLKIAMSSNSQAVLTAVEIGSKVNDFRSRLKVLQSVVLALVKPLPKPSAPTILVLPSQVREYISGLKNLADEATRFAVIWPQQRGYRYISAIIKKEIEGIKTMTQTDVKDTLEYCHGMQKHYANQLSLQKAATTNFRNSGRIENLSPSPRVEVYRHRVIFLEDEDLQYPSTYANYRKYLCSRPLVNEPRSEAGWDLIYKKAYGCFDQIRLAEFYATQLGIEKPCAAYNGLESDICKFRRGMESSLKSGEYTARLVEEWRKVVDQYLATIHVMAERKVDQSQDLPEPPNLKAGLRGLPDFLYPSIKYGVAEHIVLHGQAQRYLAMYPNRRGFDSILRSLNEKIDSELRKRRQEMSEIQRDLAFKDLEDSKAHFQSRLEHEAQVFEKEVERKKRLLVQRKRGFDMDVARRQAMRRVSTCSSLLSINGPLECEPDEDFSSAGPVSLEAGYNRVRQSLAVWLAKLTSDAEFNNPTGDYKPQAPQKTDMTSLSTSKVLGKAGIPVHIMMTQDTHHQSDRSNTGDECRVRGVVDSGNLEGYADAERAGDRCQTPDEQKIGLETKIAGLETKVARQAIILKSLGYCNTSDESAELLEQTILAVENRVLKTKLAKLEILLERKTNLIDKINDTLLEAEEVHDEQMRKSQRESIKQATEIGILSLDKTNLEYKAKELQVAESVFDRASGKMGHIPLYIPREKSSNGEQILDQQLFDMCEESKMQIESLEMLGRMLSAIVCPKLKKAREKAEKRAEKYEREQNDRILGLEKRVQDIQASKEEEMTKLSEEIAEHKALRLDTVRMASNCIERLDEAESERHELRDRITDLKRRLSRKTVEVRRGVEQISAEKQAREEMSQKLWAVQDICQHLLTEKDKECAKLREKEMENQVIIGKLEELVASEKRKIQSLLQEYMCE